MSETRLDQTGKYFDPSPFIKEQFKELALFGTTGGEPAAQWRNQFINEIETLNCKRITEGLDLLNYFNPQLPPGTWTPEAAVQEAEHLARAAVLALAVTSEASSPASIAEVGFAAIGSLIRGQRIGINIQKDPTMPEQVVRSRNLATALITEANKQYPLFYFAPDIHWLRYWSLITLEEITKMSSSESRVTFTPSPIYLPDNSANLINIISVFGTGSPDLNLREKLIQPLRKSGAQYFDAWKHDWNPERDIRIELNLKKRSKIVINPIFPDTEGYGAIAESGLLLFNALLRGQQYVLHVEKHQEAQKSDSQRARTLILAHCDRIKSDFPELPFHVTQSFDELLEVTSKFGSEMEGKR